MQTNLINNQKPASSFEDEAEKFIKPFDVFLSYAEYGNHATIFKIFGESFYDELLTETIELAIKHNEQIYLKKIQMLLLETKIYFNQKLKEQIK